MAKKNFFRRIGEFLRIVKPKETPGTPPTSPSTPVKPSIPPHPRHAPASELTVAERVAQYKAQNVGKRKSSRPQDEESEFWRLYDGGQQ